MQLNIGLSSAYDVIKDTYDYETCKEIVEHGCVSGVAHDHIYYKDTLSFFDKYEDEMIEYIADTLGGETNEDLWTRNSCNITGYNFLDPEQPLGHIPMCLPAEIDFGIFKT